MSSISLTKRLDNPHRPCHPFHPCCPYHYRRCCLWSIITIIATLVAIPILMPLCFSRDYAVVFLRCFSVFLFFELVYLGSSPRSSTLADSTTEVTLGWLADIFGRTSILLCRSLKVRKRWCLQSRWAPLIAPVLGFLQAKSSSGPLNMFV